MMKLLGKKVANLIDRGIARNYLTYFREGNSLIIFAFHSVVKDEKEYDKNVIDPSLSITVDKLRRVIDYFLGCGYRFVGPRDVLNGLHDGKYVMMTFDDGYSNNLNAVSLLSEYEIPAVIYLSTGHIEKGKSFWWDVLYRERMKSGVSARKLLFEKQKFKSMTNEEIERYMIGNFGEKSLRPICDIDRPFAPSEIGGLSRVAAISWGNHTSEHAILTNYPADKVRTQISGANRRICEMTGEMPISIAYPNGLYSAEIVAISQELGLRLGVTTEKIKNRFPVDYGTLMTLGRFSFNNRVDVVRQCEVFRSDINTYAIRNFIKRYF